MTCSAGAESRSDDEVVNRRVRHDVERLDETARDELFVVGEDSRALAEQALYDIGRLLGRYDDAGRRRPRARSGPLDTLERPVGVTRGGVPCPHNRRDRSKYDPRFPPNNHATETFHQSATSSGSAELGCQARQLRRRPHSGGRHPTQLSAARYHPPVEFLVEIDVRLPPRSRRASAATSCTQAEARARSRLGASPGQSGRSGVCPGSLPTAASGRPPTRPPCTRQS